MSARPRGGHRRAKALTIRDNILCILQTGNTHTATQIWQVAYDALGGMADSDRHVPTLGTISSELKKLVNEKRVEVVPNFGPRNGNGYKLSLQGKEITHIIVDELT